MYDTVWGNWHFFSKLLSKGRGKRNYDNCLSRHLFQWHLPMWKWKKEQHQWGVLKMWFRVWEVMTSSRRNLLSLLFLIIFFKDPWCTDFCFKHFIEQSLLQASDEISVMHTDHQILTSCPELLHRDFLIGIFQYRAKDAKYAKDAKDTKDANVSVPLRKKTQPHNISCLVPAWCLCWRWQWQWRRLYLKRCPGSDWDDLSKPRIFNCESKEQVEYVSLCMANTRADL